MHPPIQWGLPSDADDELVQRFRNNASSSDAEDEPSKDKGKAKGGQGTAKGSTDPSSFPWRQGRQGRKG